ncbi:hypothetical protein VPH35_026362 [Triticum aestivum]|uniref:Uncharacterized protein n=1 Tax=Triticum turgidum subsp. durum TaxID=4567 RepID=A0A9R1PDB3_TRITD|nr:unnamed protein product [Triticum turgidum subsp. durum]
MRPATAATTASSPEAGTSLKANLVHVAPVPLMRVGWQPDLPRPEPVSSSSLSSFLPWLRRGLRQGSHDEGQRGRLLPSMEAMSATWAHTWLRFKVNPRPSFLFDLI